ncbi:MAG: hypothetical protein AAF639_16060 [Chloroflexota bacterium]
MSKFEPTAHDELMIETPSGITTYQFVAHPAVPSMAFGQEGRKAQVYQLRAPDGLYALKIFKKPFRLPHLVQTCEALSQFNRKGLEVCDRICLTDTTAPALIQQYPELEYAILMPWMEGTTWFDIIYAQSALEQETALQLAHQTAIILANLEAEGLAHCDIAGANVMVGLQKNDVSLIDVEDMFGPGLTLTEGFPQGTDGYHHLASRQHERGQWCAEGDRFAGAVLLAEMVTWHDEAIQRAADEEHFFADGEMQDSDCDNYKLMVEALTAVSSELAALFTQAWTSQTLADCPPLQAWVEQLAPLVPTTTAKTIYDAVDNPVVGWVPIGATDTTIATPQASALPKSTRVPMLQLPLTATVGQAYEIGWTVVADATEYELQVAYHAINASKGVFTKVYQGADVVFSTSNTLAKDYYYRVRALLDSGQKGHWSAVEVVSVHPDDSIPSPQERHLPTLASPTWINYEWHQVTDAQAYTIAVALEWNRTHSEDRYELEHTDVAGSSDVTHRSHAFYKMTLQEGTHEFRVRVADKHGRYGPWGSVLTVYIYHTRRFFWQPRVYSVEISEE